MLIEIKGKIYEIRNIYLFLIFILMFFSLIYLSYLGVDKTSAITLKAEPSKVVQHTANRDVSGNTPKENIKENIQNVCFMNGRGRRAKKIGTRYDCRSTEDIMIINTKDGNVVCCVVP